ncbi:CBS domain-containing protein [Methylomarinum sp. Ch1-1]|uniref:CBS domain-containing protein n=1 Tax=Methylomarinum roseum TaxID=3067653 RepID=A0AAU7NX33_9GAMM|nr:CBS domain-containing protein [Methylomarinum sp. Ch1-1]MDP4522393.1 CBS domain-containing protein [Methylomarinum sp. Ch1-1]
MRLWLLLLSFFGILLLITLLNARINGGFKIESSWIAIALAPTIIWLLSSGQLAELSGFGVAFKLREAVARPFSLKIHGSKITPEVLSSDEKGSYDAIQNFIRNRIPAMTLQLGRKGYYYGPVIMEYLKQLTQHDFFRYVVFIDDAGKFSALVSARPFYEQLRANKVDIVNLIETNDLEPIKGLISSAISSDSNKREVLEKMAHKNLSELPVIDEDGYFIGIIDRDKLTSSIVLDLVAEKQ